MLSFDGDELVMNRVDRLLAMIVFLQGRRVTRADDLATHFEISARTVYRDLAALGEAGVPVVGEPGVGYNLMKGYHLPPVMFTQEEAAALFVAGELAERMTDASVQGPVQEALQKIRAILPRQGQEFVNRLEPRVGVRGHKSDRRKAWLGRLHTAVAGHHVVKMHYQDGRDELTWREVEPAGLIFYGGRWHLVGWCRLRQDERDFRTDRIEKLELLGERFEPRTEFRADDYLCRRMTDAVKHEAVMRMPRWAMDRVRRDWSVGLVHEAADGNAVKVTLLTSSLDWLARWLLAFGPEVSIQSPTELRAKVRELAMETAATHEP